MDNIFESKLAGLRDLCEEYRVNRLELFGSAAGESYDPENSDIDFLVEFLPETDLGPWMTRYFDLKKELEKLFGCSVDLVMASALRNPYFIREVERTRKQLYAA